MSTDNQTTADTSAPLDGSAAAATAATPTATTAADGGSTQAGTAPAASPDASGTAPDSTEGKPADTKPAGAPEKYEFVAPEGKTFDTDILGAFENAVREIDLPQDQAQQLLDKMAPTIEARQQAQIAKVQAGWLEAAQADAEFGGAKLEENMAIAKQAMTTFATPELRALLGHTKLGDHPEVIRTFYRVGKAISEDKVVGGKGSAPTKSAADILYDKGA